MYNENTCNDEYNHNYSNEELIPQMSGHNHNIPPHKPPLNQSSNADDQKLLSVSGKKKCSHCGEELGNYGEIIMVKCQRLYNFA